MKASMPFIKLAKTVLILLYLHNCIKGYMKIKLHLYMKTIFKGLFKLSYRIQLYMKKN